MSAQYTDQPCQCELCKPNWHLGDNGEFEVQAPADLAQEHAAKVERAGLKPGLVPVPN